MSQASPSPAGVRPLTRRGFLGVSAAALSSWVLGCTAPRPGKGGRARGRPNILFIFADDHAWQAISAYGSRVNETPHIDRIAEEGVLFRNCTVTNSICAPSRAVVLTGKHSHLNGVTDNGKHRRFDPAQVTFPRLLHAAGYQTGFVGKWHLASEPVGFDDYCRLIGQGAYYNPDMIRNGKKVRFQGYTTEIITRLTLDWLEQRDPGRPFIMMCQHKAPHRNWMPGPRQIHLYENEVIPEPETLFDDYAGRASPARLQEMTIARHLREVEDLKITPPGDSSRVTRRMTPEQRRIWDAAYEPRNERYRRLAPRGKDRVRYYYQRYMKDYLRCVAGVDESVGELLDYLDRRGLAEDTIVVYSSDQGFYLGEHGWFDKRWMYKESFRMPFIVRWPGVTPPGTENTALVQNLDFAETFLDAAGLPVPEEMQGRSLVPLLRGETPPDWRKSVYYHYYEYPAVHAVRRHEGVSTGRYKLIHYYRMGEWELFDLLKDPRELHSVYDDPAYARVRKELKAELARLKKRYRVPEEDPS